MYIPDFTYHKPTTVRDACRILAEHAGAAPLAGGTDLLVELKQGVRRQSDLVSLRDIAQLREIALTPETIRIGAGATHNEVRDSAAVREVFPSIAAAAATIGTDQVRNAGTLGGNLCTGASCADMAPILLALDAELEIAGLDATRRMPIREFFLAHRSTRLQRGELMTHVVVRRGGAPVASWYEKFGLREAASISVASAAVALTLDRDRCVAARVVIGAAAPTPKLSDGASAILAGQPLAAMTAGAPLLARAGEAAAADSVPIDDIRGTADYRRSLVRVLVGRAVIRALEASRRGR